MHVWITNLTAYVRCFSLKSNIVLHRVFCKIRYISDSSDSSLKAICFMFLLMECLIIIKCRTPYKLKQWGDCEECETMVARCLNTLVGEKKHKCKHTHAHTQIKTKNYFIAKTIHHVRNMQNFHMIPINIYLVESNTKSGGGFGPLTDKCSKYFDDLSHADPSASCRETGLIIKFDIYILPCPIPVTNHKPTKSGSKSMYNDPLGSAQRSLFFI